MRIMKALCVATLGLSVAGCAESVQKVKSMNWAEVVGTLGGAAIGGFAGAQFGGGVGQSAFTAAGVLIGGTAGFVGARMLAPSDQAEYERTVQHALNEAPDGHVVRWRNPETGRSGIFRSVASYQRDSGQRCRQYRSSVVFDDGVFNGGGTACLQADGRWLKLHDEFS